MKRVITVVGTLNPDMSWGFDGQVQDFADDGTLVNSTEGTASIGSTSGVSDGQTMINGTSLLMGQLSEALR